MNYNRVCAQVTKQCARSTSRATILFVSFCVIASRRSLKIAYRVTDAAAARNCEDRPDDSNCREVVESWVAKSVYFLSHAPSNLRSATSSPKWYAL
jgi:hypothetical protein